ncbi:MAG: L-seryl-tRNA(Sec) selenium transferase [Syntrophorhabdaceae bacterium]|nr:L-seryl-tRNA(Sec) selenium transferase [Syntrophorhabdaceae bacterium]
MILESRGFKSLKSRFPELVLKEALHEYLDDLRLEIKNGLKSVVPGIDEIIREVSLRTQALVEPGLKRVINATGVIIHTNLGRSVLAKEAIDAIMKIATGYSNLEYNLEKGTRGSRYDHCAAVLKRLTSAGDALVVNNNAGAVFLVLNTLAEGKEVIISRGELIEIGGSFRVPDVMEKSGALLKEVGTTNRTYIEDFERAIGDNTGLIMKAHTSNYRIRGFTHEASSEELVRLGVKYGIPTYFDTGSGLFHAYAGFGHTGEPVISDELKAGFDVISFSGDKLLGAPQAGIILGKEECLDIIKHNPITRALRPDKFTLAGLEATLLLCLDPVSAARKIPTIAMISGSKEDLTRRARRLASHLKKRCPGADISVVDIESEVGGGSFPDMMIPSAGIALVSSGMTADACEKRLRQRPVPVIARIEKERLLFDMRTVLAHDETDLAAAIISVYTDAP